jgi:hypothetical protein
MTLRFIHEKTLMLSKFPQPDNFARYYYVVNIFDPTTAEVVRDKNSTIFTKNYWPWVKLMSPLERREGLNFLNYQIYDLILHSLGPNFQGTCSNYKDILDQGSSGISYLAAASKDVLPVVGPLMSDSYCYFDHHKNI